MTYLKLSGDSLGKWNRFGTVAQQKQKTMRFTIGVGILGVQELVPNSPRD